MSLLAASLMIPSGRSYADNDPPGNHGQRQDLREDLQQLEQLRKRRDHELREGDRREAREYNQKIRNLQKDIHRDRRNINEREDYRRHHRHGHDYDDD
jgi:hypothetical protein